MLRTLIIAVFVIAAALLGETQASKAQSAYSYPWCGIRYTQDGSSTSCYYTSWEQCMATLAGAAGGLCVESPYYHARAKEPVHRPSAKPRVRRHAE